MQIISRVGLKPGHIVMDAGTGEDAHFARVLAAFVKPFGKVVAIDNCPEKLNKAIKFIKSDKLEKVIELRKDDLRNLTFPNNFFNLVAGYNVLPYINRKEWSRVMSEMLRVTKFGGKVLLIEKLPEPENRSQLNTLRIHNIYCKIFEYIGLRTVEWYPEPRKIMRLPYDIAYETVKPQISLLVKTPLSKAMVNRLVNEWLEKYVVENEKKLNSKVIQDIKKDIELLKMSFQKYGISPLPLQVITIKK